MTTVCTIWGIILMNTKIGQSMQICTNMRVNVFSRIPIGKSSLNIWSLETLSLTCYGMQEISISLVRKIRNIYFMEYKTDIGSYQWKNWLYVTFGVQSQFWHGGGLMYLDCGVQARMHGGVSVSGGGGLWDNSWTSA